MEFVAFYGGQNKGHGVAQALFKVYVEATVKAMDATTKAMEATERATKAVKTSEAVKLHGEQGEVSRISFVNCGHEG